MPAAYTLCSLGKTNGVLKGEMRRIYSESGARRGAVRSGAWTRAEEAKYEPNGALT